MKLKWTHLNTEISHAAFREERNIHDSTFFSGAIYKGNKKQGAPPYHASFYKVGGRWAGESCVETLFQFRENSLKNVFIHSF